MRFLSRCASIAVLSLLWASAVVLAQPPQAVSAAPAATPAKVQAPDPPAAPITPLRPPFTGLAAMPAPQLADLAAEHIRAASHRLQDYVYLDTEHNQNYIDGALVVDHTTVSESIFIGGLPYLRKLSVDGQALAGKDLAQENKLYDKAVKERTSLNEETRARLMKHDLNNNRTDLDHLAERFHVEVAGQQTLDDHECLVLDVTPVRGTTDPDLQRHMQIAIDTATRNVINLRIEYLADDNGFDKGTVLETRYHLLGGTIALPYRQSFDSVVQVPQLLNKKIHVVKSHTYSNYRKFRATVTIHEVEGPPPPETP